MFKIFEALTMFDWITPLWGMFQDIRHDPTLLQTNSWTFFIPYEKSAQGGWNGFAITGLLNRYGIKTWGSQITNGQFFFSVKLDQAQWAEYLLLRKGVPINEKYLGAPRPKGRANKPPGGSGESSGDSFFDDLIGDFLDEDFW
jgi:hypothetical protein